ncbi:MAG: single-stranded-DNA-specific exonuclease RecJ [Planctomycetaceae bacterium]|jgi:single-stranded-DNA-specific exonuclease|nr:single-stranded-DNA-specific exonuclease RecJ [Planctomycetaceae bacterium]
MSKFWKIHSYDQGHVTSLGQRVNVHPLIAQLLIGRGITTPEAAASFLTPKLTNLRPPEMLPGCVQVAEKLHDAIKSGKKITVFGDYDADGMTGTAILRQVIRLLGGNVNYYVPARLSEGYGLNHDAIRQLALQGTELIVTTDCGINGLDEAQTAKEVHVELLITDHHTPGETLPEASAIAHPMLGGTYPFPELCGAMVAFKVAWMLCQLKSDQKETTAKLPAAMRDFLLQAVGLAAIGTVADVMPLLDENRMLVRYALENSLKKSVPVGLQELMKAAGLKEGTRLSSETIAFTLAPRLNAAGRLGFAQLGVELLVTDKPERAAEIAQYINGLNESRQKLERDIFRSAVQQIEDKFSPEDSSYVLADASWHAGIIGIVAGRLAEKYHKPIILIAKDRMQSKPAGGSARTIKGLNLYNALNACSEYLLRFGGHAAAAGLTIEDKNIDLFRDAFCEVTESMLPHENRIQELFIDAEFPLSVFQTDIVRQMEALAPFGQANKRPVLCTCKVALTETAKTMGQDNRHFTATFRQGEQKKRAVAFGEADWVEPMNSHNGPIDIAFHPVINEFRGVSNVELQLLDWRPSRE